MHEMDKYRYIVKQIDICFVEGLGVVLFGFFLISVSLCFQQILLEDSPHFFSISNNCPHHPLEGEKLTGEETGSRQA